MFTGLIEAKGTVVATRVEGSQEGGDLWVSVPAGRFRSSKGEILPFEMGESVAINGACLTVVEIVPTGDDVRLKFELSGETYARTSLGSVSEGGSVNVERAMTGEKRFGGHIVQGHVDGLAEIVSITPTGNSVVFRFRVPEGGSRYLIDKGSVTLDGISLTVVSPEGDAFDVWVIPHTLQETNLGDRQPGDVVNLEYDVVAKYLEKLSTPYRG